MTEKAKDDPVSVERKRYQLTTEASDEQVPAHPALNAELPIESVPIPVLVAMMASSENSEPSNGADSGL